MGRKIKVLAALLGMCLMSVSMSVAAEELSADGDFSYVEHTDTVRDEESSCQLTVATECPAGFGLNTYVVVSDADGLMYRVSLSEENGYQDRMYVKPGEYRVVEAKVFDDNTGRYPFDLVDGEENFTLENEGAYELTFRLQDYDAIAAIISAEAESEEESVLSDAVQENRYDTALDGVQISSIGELFYPVESEGSGIGTMAVSGNAKGDYDLVVQIIKSGVIGEARFSLSLDGGESLIGDDVTAERFELRDYGLVLNFATENDVDELQEGDIFRAKIPETFSVTAAKYGEANVILAGSPEKDYDVLVTILSSGGRGEAKFTISLDAGNTSFATDTIPENGIYELPDGMKLCFSASDGYSKGSEYSAEVRSNMHNVSMIPLYVLAAVVFAVGLGLYAYLLSKREKAADYVIHKWKDRQDADVYG